MLKSVDRSHICLVLSALFVLCSPAAETQPDPASADARLRALYTAEWNWRQREIAGSDQTGEAGARDHFPRVDAASQQARLAYWTRRSRRSTASRSTSSRAEEKVNAQVFRTSHPRARQRREVPDLRSAVQQRHVLLDGVHAAPGLRDARRVSQLSRRGCATCRATSTSRSSTCAPASRAASRCRACRSSAATRRSSRT